jgi:hypothetical protein
MAIEYKILFRVELFNDYFADEKARHLEIVPAEDTAIFLKNQQILFRQLGNRFILLSKIAGDGKPFIPLAPTAVFRFYVQIADYPFLQYSGLPFVPASPQRYYFSNQTVNSVSSSNPAYAKNYISKKIDSVYNTAINYHAGDLVINNITVNEIFEAVRKGINKPLNDPGFWFRRTTAVTPKQYVHKGDLHPFAGSTYYFHLASGTTKVGINIFRYDATTSLYTQAASSYMLEFESTIQDIPITINNLAPGKYKIFFSYDGNEENQEIYVDPGMLLNGRIGVIEIFNNLPAASPYSFLDSAGKIKDPETKFSLRFASRLAYWKYITKTDSVKAVKEKNNAFIFGAAGPLQFLTTSPVAFAEKPYNIVIDFKKDAGSPNVDIEGIKNGSYLQLKRIALPPDETFDCSEIYLNY